MFDQRIATGEVLTACRRPEGMEFRGKEDSKFGSLVGISGSEVQRYKMNLPLPNYIVNSDLRGHELFF